MNFEFFVKKGLVRAAKKEIPFIKSIIKNADTDLLLLKRLEIDEISSRTVMIRYYDILRVILEAISANKGYKIYSHEAFTYLLQEIGEEIISIKFDRFRKIRNGLMYYGKNILPAETKENSEEILKIINYLKKKYLKDV
jgi:hypothetical protein